MSSWYVFNAIGLYPYSPADPDYVVTVPLFNKVTVALTDTTSLQVQPLRGDGKQAPSARFGEELYRSARIFLSRNSENRRTDPNVCPKPSLPGLSLVANTAIAAVQCAVDFAVGAILHGLLAAEYQRFQRSRQDLPQVREILEKIFNRKLSARTERRYRSPTSSQPHVDALIQLTLTNVTRYSDSIRMRRTAPSDHGRFSLEALLDARHLSDVSEPPRRTHVPVPSDRWIALRKEYVEWPTLLSLRFPQLRLWDDQVVRFPQGSAIHGVEPPISPGALMLIDKFREHRIREAIRGRRAGVVLSTLSQRCGDSLRARGAGWRSIRAAGQHSWRRAPGQVPQG
jgi:hypothetical protein